MKPRLILVLCLLGLAGCSTIEKRAEEKSAVFAQLNAAEQANLRKGIVEIGYTKDMVYIALGKPNSEKDTVTAQGKDEIWIYSSVSSEYIGDRTLGYRRWVTYDPERKVLWTYYEPIREPVFSDHFEDRIRITFREDKVAVIEQIKPQK